MTRPKRTGGAGGRPAAKKASAARAGGGPKRPAGAKVKAGPKRNMAQGRDGTTRDSAKPVRERGTLNPEARAGEGTRAVQATERTATRGGKALGRGGNAAQVGGSNPARRKTTERAAVGALRGDDQRGSSERGRGPGREARADTGRKAPPKTAKKPLPELRRVQLDAPPSGTVFRDRDGAQHSFPDSNLKRVAAAILTEKRKAWRYRPFSFPLFTDKGNEQAFHFDFYIYDAEDSVIRLILVVPAESREVWDRVGRFKRQYPMYAYELWTPEKLARLSKPRAQLGF